MKITAKRLRQIIREELDRDLLNEKKIVLSMEKGDYQSVMKGDPFDYEYDTEADTFTVSGLNAKGQKAKGKRRARYDRAIGRKFGKGKKTHATLMGRLKRGGYDPDAKPKTEPKTEPKPGSKGKKTPGDKSSSDVIDTKAIEADKKPDHKKLKKQLERRGIKVTDGTVAQGGEVILSFKVDVSKKKNQVSKTRALQNKEAELRAFLSAYYKARTGKKLSPADVITSREPEKDGKIEINFASNVSK